MAKNVTYVNTKPIKRFKACWLVCLNARYPFISQIRRDTAWCFSFALNCDFFHSFSFRFSSFILYFDTAFVSEATCFSTYLQIHLTQGRI